MAALLSTCASRPRVRPGLARGTTALHRTREPCRKRGGLLELKGQLQLARRGARARQARLLRLLPKESACGGRSLAHMREPAAREAKARGVAPRLFTERESPIASPAAF